MKHSKKWFSILVAMSLVILFSLIALFILDYMIPFSRNIKWVENASNAYYQANAGIEQVLWHHGENMVWYQTWNTLSLTPVDFSFDLFAIWTVLPPSWEGNSEYNNDWNILRQGEPIQLEIWDNVINSWSDFKLYVRVPNLDNNISTWEELTGTKAVVNWQLTSKNNALNSSWSQLMAGSVNASNLSKSLMDIFDFTWAQWVDLSDIPMNLSPFYANECWSGSGCILKLSVINSLDLLSGQKAPYLEWQLDAWWDIPLRYAVIESSGKSYGFKKDLKIRVPQTTVSEAFDFTIFQ